MKKLAVFSVAIFTTIGGMTSAKAAAIIQNFSGGGDFGFWSPPGGVIGFRFTAEETGLLTALGVINSGNSAVLNGSHEVGVWRNSDQLLLGSVVVDPSSPTVFEENGWFYESVAPIAVTKGVEYTLGAYYSDTDGDSYRSGPTTLDTAHISGTNGVFPNSSAFEYPTGNSNNLARLGPNAIFAIPEPTSATLIGAGILGICFLRRRV